MSGLSYIHPINNSTMNKVSAGLIALFSAAITVTTTAEARGPMTGVTSDSKFIIYYGDDYYSSNTGDPSTWVLDSTIMSGLASFDVVVINPGQPHCTPEVVKYLKDNGVDYVIGYISIGEDFINDAIEDPLGGGTGMVKYDSATGDLIPTPGNTLQSFYVDVDSQTVTYDGTGRAISVTTTARLTPDGNPDYNPIFLGYMVNPDTNWRWVLNNMRIGGSGVTGRGLTAGLAQIAGAWDTANLRDRSTNFGCDGFFLDTLDTAGPYDAPGWYPWTVDEMRDTVKYISDNYTDKVVFANRGAFYFSAGLQSPLTGEYPIDYSIRPYINAFLYESFRYDSDPVTDGPGGISEYYNENRYNVAPKVFAEANRDDGFTMFSLEYESGRTGIVTDAFNTDIRKFGYIGYLCEDGLLITVDTDFANLLPDSSNDTNAPTWDTTGNVLYNTASTSFRVGVQEVEEGSVITEAIVRWDVAIDQSYPITYDIIVTDIAASISTTYTDVAFDVNPDWGHDPANNSANEFTVTGLTANKNYNIKVVAKDALGNQNTEDTGLNYYASAALSNPILSSAITLDGLLTEWGSLTSYIGDPDDVTGVSDASHISGAGNQANWRQIQVAHATDTGTLYFAYTNDTNIYISWGFQIFIDTDDNPATGFQGSFAGITNFPIGADYLIEGVNVYQYNGTGLDWNWIAAPAAGGFQVGRIWSGTTGEVYLPLTWIGSPSGTMSFVCFGNNEFYTGVSGEYDWYPDGATSGASFRYSF